ncbi:cutinase-domain-containing protein [Penicillium argentinense]|uniref:Cutinase-domain-containing protein n=1 Tax=Penicillium argentinense TaxID=1131581 RepID=A0A9W9G421_9EURO|nr:cutinase-domain-containing protein [Penicillium argentinense]KAJ5111230.1 cutinase-domain-containing protein [Penicillium argentinense]
MLPTLRLSFLAVLATCASSFARPSIFARDTSLSEALETFECRCGTSEFLSLPHANITAWEKAKQCSSYKLIDARGTAEPQGVSTVFYPLIENILANISGGVSLPVEYPAGPAQNTTVGEDFVLNTINEGLYHCPGQKYALFGYSQGATLMLRVLNQLDRNALSLVKSVILVGNPYRTPGKFSSVNETGQRDHSNTVGMFTHSALAANTNATIPHLSSDIDRSGKVLDYCLAGDGVCSYNPACSCQIPAGHLSYGLVDTVQTTAFEHVVSRISEGGYN